MLAERAAGEDFGDSGNPGWVLRNSDTRSIMCVGLGGASEQ